MNLSSSFKILRRFNRLLLTSQRHQTFHSFKKKPFTFLPNNVNSNLKNTFILITKYSDISTKPSEKVDLDEDEKKLLKEEDSDEDEKIFKNMYYFKEMIEKNEEYTGTLFNLETVKNETKYSTNEVLLTFRQLLKDYEEDPSRINQERLENFKDLLNDQKNWLKFYELAEIIHGFCLNDHIRQDEIHKDLIFKIILLLDKSCHETFHDRCRNENAFLAHLWCITPYAHKSSDFLFKYKLATIYNIKNLSKSQVI